MSKNKLTEEQIERISRAFANVRYANLLGMELRHIERGSASVCLEAREELLQNRNVVHGGAIASLIDTATAFAILPILEKGQSTTTVDLTIHYLRPLTKGRITATARIIRAGRKVITLSAEVFDDDGKLAATALTTYLRLVD
jgi:uncharacterized protein (TIGR00369 family)